MTDAIRQFPRKKARTLRFSCGAPRSARVIADGSRALFLRSDGPEDTVTSLWMSVIDEDGNIGEIPLADPRVLLADADAEDVPAEEKARRERAREGGSGIVSYCVDGAGNRVTFTINGQLFLTDLTAGATRAITIEEDELKPVLNPRISPDGRHIIYTTGTYLVDVDLANDEETGDAISVVASAPQNGEWKIGLAEFAAGEEMDRYDGFWWSPDSKYVLFETYDESPEPIWHLSDPANPTNPAQANRYPQALTANADVRLTLLELGYDSDNCCYGAIANEVQWDHESYEYLAAVSWSEGHDPIILVQDRLQQHDQVLAIHVGEPIATMRDAENGFTDDNGDEVLPAAERAFVGIRRHGATDNIAEQIDKIPKGNINRHLSSQGARRICNTQFLDNRPVNDEQRCRRRRSSTVAAPVKVRITENFDDSQE